MPEGTVDVIPVDLVVGAICAVAGARPRAGAADRAGRVGLDEPVALSRPRRPRARMVQRAPALRQRRDSRSWSRRGRSPAVARCRGSSTGPSGCSSGPRRRSRCSGARRGRTGARPLEERRSEVERALSYVELYGAYAECEADLSRRPPDGGVGQPRRRGSTRASRSTRVRSTGRTTSPKSTCRPSCSTRGCARRPAVAAADVAKTAARRGARHPGVISRRSTSRTRSSRRTSSSRTHGSPADGSTATTGCG